MHIPGNFHAWICLERRQRVCMASEAIYDICCMIPGFRRMARRISVTFPLMRILRAVGSHDVGRMSSLSYRTSLKAVGAMKHVPTALIGTLCVTQLRVTLPHHALLQVAYVPVVFDTTVEKQSFEERTKERLWSRISCTKKRKTETPPRCSQEDHSSLLYEYQRGE